MSSINNVGNNSPVYSVNRAGPRPVVVPPAATSAVRGQDTVELSSQAQDISNYMAVLKSGGDVRTDKVAQIKAQIAAGTYEDDKKLDAAADKLLDEIFG